MIPAAATAPLPPVSFAHLIAMTGDHGLAEHAMLRAPRLEHGTCTDDVARELTVLVLEPERTPELERVTDAVIDYLAGAITPNGTAHNRRTTTGAWTDRATTEDCWGRAIGGLGSAVRHSATPQRRDRAMRILMRAARTRSNWARSSAFAAIGAADALASGPDERTAAVLRSLLVDCLERVPREPTSRWAWPESTLRYANAAICSALIAGGDALGDEAMVRDGLDALTELLRIETGTSGRLSVVGTSGRAPGEAGPLWDQQPIEPAAIADACAIALRVTGDARWADGVRLAWAWFTGENDAGVVMVDLETGAGFDGLEPGGRNENCGAESTIAAISTLQHARALPVAAVA